MSTPDPRLAYPAGRPAQAVRQLLDALHQLVDGLRAGHQWVSYAEWGLITQVDTDAKTATLHTATWEGAVTYGQTPPAVGDWQIGYFPNTGTPWIKTRARTGVVRWLYYRLFNDLTNLMELWRVRWPLTATSAAAAQRVRAAVPAWSPDRRSFCGFHVPGRLLVERYMPWTAWGIEGPGSSPTSATATVTTYGDWGFGDAVTVDTGRRLRVGSVAPDLRSGAPGELWLSGMEPLAELVHYGVLNPPTAPDGTPFMLFTTFRLIVSRDGGATWTDLDTFEYFRQVRQSSAPTQWAQPATYPAVTVPRFVPGGVEHGALALPFPLLTTVAVPTTDDPLEGPPLVTLGWQSYSAAGGLHARGGVGPGPLLATQVAAGQPQANGLPVDGALLAFTAPPTAAPVFTPGPGWAAPATLARGDGTPDGLAWTALTPAANGVTWTASDPMTGVSVDGQDWLAWQGRAARSMSQDGGTTWTPAPSPWAGGATDPFIADDVLFVDIPASDPVALEAPR